MKDGLTEMSNNQVAGLKPDDVHWVLTVPALWNDSAKHFMRLAALQVSLSFVCGKKMFLASMS